jgi:signal transduction histidine kinase
MGLQRQLLPHIAALELEVDRLRRHNHLLRQEALEAVQRIDRLTATAGTAEPAPAIRAATQHLGEVLRDLQDLPGYHPSLDQVIAIAVRPLAEQVFRWQQRLQGRSGVGLRLGLDSEHVEWFPSRLRHILDGLLGNALRYCDPGKPESWVYLGARATAEGYELRVSDNGVGVDSRENERLFDLLSRAGPTRVAGLGVGLAVVKYLVEQSNGELTVASTPEEGTTFVVRLPRYDLDDFLV